MPTVRLELGARAYSIDIGAGLLDEAALYRPWIGSGQVAVVTNRVVAPLYLARVERALRRAGASPIAVVVEDGEQAKSWETLDRVIGAMLAARCGRDALLVALGGGVVGDLAGFAAAVYQRGIAFLQLPTTLLAQVDSSVGGKTAINHALGKNMIGVFHQPRAVIADVATLETLPDRELSAGLAEVIKHGLILDLEFVEWLEANMAKLRARRPQALQFAVQRCCELKARVVAADERESGLRAILNFGHTFGHAIELGLGYGDWLHGEAVAAGMVMAAELSMRSGGLGAAEVARVRTLIESAGLPVRGPALESARLLELMRGDKKAVAGGLRFVLLDALGRASLRENIDPRLVSDSIAASA
ncbi:MAG TPA: 3-dehydroquinate synthase [Candidatus Binataceae bacterium]|nr:3-dehydroquinate synthase [Candidatus Binataceae bacterium]